MAVQLVENQAEKIASTPQKAGSPFYSTSLYVQYDGKVRPTMRASTRWDYLKEYLGFYVDHWRFLLYAVILVGGGGLLVFTNNFVPLGLLMIALGAKYKCISWWDKFVYAKFGANRSLVLMN